MSKNIDYKNLEELVVKSQEEFDMVPDDFKGRIYIEFGIRSDKAIVNRNFSKSVVARGNSSVVARGNSSVVARGNSSVEAWENSSVVARENSSVVARGNSSVEAWGNSSVVARENSSVEAWENSSVVARENSSVVARGNSSVEAWENSSVVARENSSVEAWGNSSVVARENSSVEAWGNSSVEAWENSSVEAWENSSVVARGNSSVEAWGNSSVEAWGNSSVEAWGNSSVEAWENSSVEASGNTQITDMNPIKIGRIKITGNARIVHMPENIEDFMNFYGIKHDKKKAIFFKAVHKNMVDNYKILADNKIMEAPTYVYSSHFNSNFKYIVGESIREYCDSDINDDCSYGIHISHMYWALNFGKDWKDLAILEVETDINDIVLPKNSSGKVRTCEVRVLREIPLEECGVYGKILAKRRGKYEN